MARQYTQSSKKGVKGKYHEWITENGLDIIAAWKRSGLTNEQVAKNIGITHGTLCEWMARFPQIKEVLKENKEIADMIVESALFKKAKSGDMTAIIFYLTNRRSKHWQNTKYVKKEDEGEKKTNELLTSITSYIKSNTINADSSDSANSDIAMFPEQEVKEEVSHER